MIRRTLQLPAASCGVGTYQEETRGPQHAGKENRMRLNMQQRGNPQSAMCVRSILLELYKIQESAEITMVGP
jgi:hypothetical protein